MRCRPRPLHRRILAREEQIKATPPLAFAPVSPFCAPCAPPFFPLPGFPFPSLTRGGGGACQQGSIRQTPARPPHWGRALLFAIIPATRETPFPEPPLLCRCALVVAGGPSHRGPRQCGTAPEWCDRVSRFSEVLLILHRESWCPRGPFRLQRAVAWPPPAPVPAPHLGARALAARRAAWSST